MISVTKEDKKDKERRKSEVEQVLNYDHKTAYMFIREINLNKHGYKGMGITFDVELYDQDLKLFPFYTANVHKEDVDRIIKHYTPGRLPYKFTCNKKDGTVNTILTCNPISFGVDQMYLATIHRIDGEGEKKESGFGVQHGFVFTNLTPQ